LCVRVVERNRLAPVLLTSTSVNFSYSFSLVCLQCELFPPSECELFLIPPDWSDTMRES